MFVHRSPAQMPQTGSGGEAGLAATSKIQGASFTKLALRFLRQLQDSLQL
jgi:hypothetical protein